MQADKPMDILVADDEPGARLLLERLLAKEGYRVVTANDGVQALEVLSRVDPPRLAILDWMMPNMSGLEVCRAVRAREGYTYMLMVTARGEPQDVVAGLDAGMDDFLTKPFEPAELRVRLRTGCRILELETGLKARIQELNTALLEVQQLQGMLPICMHCKSIKDSAQQWHKLEAYVESHSNARFTHGLCEACLEKHYGDPKVMPR